MAEKIRMSLKFTDNFWQMLKSGPCAAYPIMLQRFLMYNVLLRFFSPRYKLSALPSAKLYPQ